LIFEFLILDSGLEKAEEVVARFATRDVFEIARAVGVQIVYENWYPTTIGEFERDRKIIRVNRRALENNRNAAELERIIIAHELGHFFAGETELDKADEEKFCNDFAKNLLK
jgi:Zn-dependent peptidase ImmA (M78 family)